MSHNPQAASAQEFHLPGHTVLSIKGRDALAFAQAQFMNDVAALPDGQWHWNGWLTPKGRVIALFALLKLDAETLWLLLPDAGADDLAAKLQRYVFRSKVVLAARDELHAAGRFSAPAQASGARFAAIDDAIELDFGGAGGPRSVRIGSAAAAVDTEAVAQWCRSDLEHGLPRLRDDQVETWTPQQLSLDRLRAFSVKKGCYPGQEIVARTHFLGQVKRGLMRLQGTGVGELDEVMAGEPAGSGISTVRPIGQLICAEGDEGLAVMPLDAGDGPFSTASQPCTRLPLLGGLAR
jgi:hypothetical protein